ncbi:MAG: AAA family ATPase [Verrucomicrobiaceae bacterium]|jgi:adenylate kinase|nr:nucleoside monophosphate kinase [bacterium]MDB4627134.1 nucleoside monophosphate kinase [bacterium]MDC0312524.1 nucleoside monophosphate kinase [Verrucomicrobiales bacterium]NCF94558.1 AAA family ATPase [Verrucomicrobiaceae bacterium]
MPDSPVPLPSADPVQPGLTAISEDAQIIFKDVWLELEQDLGREYLRFAREIILLGGAPGAGKGTNTSFILKTRGLTCPPIVVSELLDSPEARAIKEAGELVDDREVLNLVLRQLIRETYRDGAVLDGFPRTKVQVDCLRLLVDKMQKLRREFYDTPMHVHFRRPVIHIMVLFVDEKVSVERQLKRGRDIQAHNTEVQATGIGELEEIRATDLDIDAAQKRYKVFKDQTWEALQSLKETFFYHLINANGSFDDVEGNIVKELAYQSSLELDPKTYDRLRHLPLAREIIVHARQDLVRRLDDYEFDQPELFQHVVEFIDQKIMPIVVRHAISGLAIVNREDALLDNPTALAMLIDIFSDRGYHAVVDLHRIEVPQQVNLETGAIECREKKVYRITIRFRGSEIRRGQA